MSPRRIAKALAGSGAIALLAIVLSAVWIVRHRNFDRLTRQALGLAPGALLHARNFHWTQMKGDTKQWELAAREASYADDRTSLKLVDTELSMMLEDGKQLLLRAPRAELKLAGNHVTRAELAGGLKLRYGDVLLMADEVIFYPDRDVLEAAGPVQIVGDGFKVKGVGLQAHPHEKLFTIEARVSSEFVPRAPRAASGKL